ncbi:hypothetical protein TNCV_841071 [Trichonephila clavipes]|nr:hypothetical protein TNCV_841071 [Trichonephila clavipes]
MPHINHLSAGTAFISGDLAFFAVPHACLDKNKKFQSFSLEDAMGVLGEDQLHSIPSPARLPFLWNMVIGEW